MSFSLHFDSTNQDIGTRSEDDESSSNSSSRRIIIPLPPSPFSSASPLTSPDDDNTPPMKFLDPAHKPSPRMLQVLRRELTPLTVLSNDAEDESWSEYQAQNTSRATLQAKRPLRKSQSTSSHMGSILATLRNSVSADNLFAGSSMPNRSSYEEIGGSDGSETNRCHCCLYINRILISFVCVGLALAITSIPSFFLANKILGTESKGNIELIQTHPDVTLSTWFSLAILFLVSVYTFFSGVKFLKRRYQDRVMSLEEAVQFARETMPEYGLRSSASPSHVRLGFLDLVRQNRQF